MSGHPRGWSGMVMRDERMHLMVGIIIAAGYALMTLGLPGY